MNSQIVYFLQKKFRIQNYKGGILLSRLLLQTESRAEAVVELLYKDMERRIAASPPGVCPVDLTAALVKMTQVQTCGKCTPCRVGLEKLSELLSLVTSHKATLETLENIELLANNIAKSADCAIGTNAAQTVLSSLEGFREDYIAHISEHRCQYSVTKSIPCMANCPAAVDIPAYIELTKRGRYADAVRVIRKDNPFPTACALVCEHPCETRCRRTLLDAPVNIRGIKRSAVDKAGFVPAPERMAPTGKKVAVVGGGPSGLSCAYFLQLMGHEVTVYEQHKKLGGMLVYGIPAYRLPRERLKEDIDCILSTGVKAVMETRVGDGDLTMDSLRREYDAVYISIGAHQDKKVGIEGEEADGVMSAVEYLGNIGDDNIPDFTGKKVCVIGGGNVAMDCTRSAIRCGAEEVRIIYRRRKEDMTALRVEVDGATDEGAIMMDLHSPVRIETDENGKVAALWAKPMMPSLIKGNRVGAADAGKEDVRIPCDIVLVAVGQGLDYSRLEAAGLPVVRGVIKAENWTAVEDAPGVFAGGDCVTGPKTAIRAIAAGKVAAANIDNYLGFNHKIRLDVDIPEPVLKEMPYCGRINMKEREPADRAKDFDLMEHAMSDIELNQEASRCLRCDHFGCGIFKGGRNLEW